MSEYLDFCYAGCFQKGDIVVFTTDFKVQSLAFCENNRAYFNIKKGENATIVERDGNGSVLFPFTYTVILINSKKIIGNIPEYLLTK